MDTSIAVAWCFEDEKTHYTEKILEFMAAGTEAIVPSIWSVEVGNAFLVAERRKRITEAEVTRFLTRLNGFFILVDSTDISQVFEQTMHHARTWKLTMYDATYLGLALREELPIATLDEALKKASQAAGITLA